MQHLHHIAHAPQPYERPNLQRLLMAVGGDLSGDSPDIRYLDSHCGLLKWKKWEAGHVLHWHPFKIRLNNTPRAGLHITTEWTTDDGDVRYGSNFKIRQPGVFVINPSNILASAEEIGAAVGDHTEASLIDKALYHRFGLRGGYREALAMRLPEGALVDPGRFFHGA